MKFARRLRSAAGRSTAVLAVLAMAASGLVVASAGPASAGPPGAAQYVHDALGRLTTIIHADGAVARYGYDPAGNVTGVVREQAGVRAVIATRPQQGPAGSAVTILGRGFATTPAGNAVTIGGAPAVVRTASATQLVVTVPGGTAGGPVAVTTSKGTASGPAFAVVSAGLPTVGQLSTATAAAGQSVSVTGTGFATGSHETWAAVNGVRAVVTAVTPTSLTFTVPGFATTGRVTVGTPLGRVTSTQDLTVPPAPLAADAVAQSLRTTIGAATATAVGTAGKVSVLAFDGAAGQRVSLSARKGTYGGAHVSLLRPDGVPLLDRQRVTASAYFDVMTLPDAGTYSLLVDPEDAATGGLELQVNDVPPDVVVPARIDGGPVAVTLGAPGQNATVRFTGTAKKRITLTVSGSSIPYLHATLTAPNGTKLKDRLAMTTSGTFIDTMVLPASGTYSLAIDGYQDGTGTANVSIDSVPPDVTGTAPLDAGPAAVTISKAGQNATLSFNGTKGGRATLLVGSGTLDYQYLTLTAPNGAKLLTSVGMSSSGRYFDTLTLPVTGTYKVLLDPHGTSTGTTSLRVDSVPADVVGTLAVDGGPVPVTLAKSGQNARLSFPGTAGGRVSVTAGSGTLDYHHLTLRAPDGSTAGISFAGVGTSGRWFDALTLPATGTYVLEIDGNGPSTGTTSARVDSVPPDATGSLAVGGPAVTTTIVKAGQNARLTLPGTAGAQVSLRASQVTLSDSWVSLLGPDGKPVLDQYGVGTSGRTLGPVTLPVTGDYTVLVDGYGTATGSMALQAFSGTAPAVTGEAEHTPTSLLPLDAPPAPVAPDHAPPKPPEDDRALHPGDWRPSKSRPAPFLADPVISGAVDAEPSPWAELGGLQGPTGSTSVSGQVLLLDGLPLPGVTLTLGGVTTTTDETGRFLLVDVPPGHGELEIDGTTANHGDVTYGWFEVGVDAVEGVTSVLPWTSWMPVIDTSTTVQLPPRPTKDVVVSTPRVPGLELHIPKGSWITGRDGQPVREVNLTPIPVDRPPFPLPSLGVDVPVYFTVQPGGAYVYPSGAQIHYPNYTDEPAGKVVDFYNYEPDKGWYVYGTGRVAPNGKSVVPDPDTKIYEFSGAMFNAGNGPPPKGPPPNSPDDGDPVDLATGLLIHTVSDLQLPGTVPLDVERTYRQGDTRSRTFGIGSTMPYDAFLWSAKQWSEVDLVLPTGTRVHMPRTSPGTSFSDAVFTAEVRSDEWSKAVMTWDAEFYGWRMRRIDGTTWSFPAFTPASAITDRHGNEVRLHRDSDKLLRQAQTSDGRWIRFEYDALKRVTSATDDLGRTVVYTYDAKGLLSSVRNPEGDSASYGYDASDRMQHLKDELGRTYLTNAYDADGRVERQTIAGGGIYRFAYTVDASGAPTSTRVTDPRGSVREVTFGPGGAALSDKEAVGTPAERVLTFVRQPGSGLLLSQTDPVGRRTDFGYDALGRQTSVTSLAGTPQASTETVGYDAAGRVSSVTDGLKRATTYSYDASGALSRVVAPGAATTTLVNDARGRPLRVTDPAGGVTTLEWSLGDLVSRTDPMGRTTQMAVDAAGRLQGETDPLGASTRYRYDGNGRLALVTDPLGGTLVPGYDEVGNLTSLTDQRGGTTTMGYDAFRRLTSTRDPLLKTESLTYDPVGSPLTYTRRSGITATYVHDALGRRTSVAFPGVTSTRTYDALDRLLTATNGSGTVTRTYAPTGGVEKETTPQGAVSYGYDPMGRRTSMTVAGQPAVSYTYSPLDRPLTITRGTKSVKITYDKLGRRTSVTLPNGVKTALTWNRSSQVTAVKVTRGTTTLGTLAYTYDGAGRTASVSGTLAKVALPDAVSGATYDAANRPTTWNGTALGYDANGNLVADGTRTYAWDQRNRLTGISGGGASASFGYDELGRRTSRTVGGTTRTFLHDGANPVQEAEGGTLWQLLNGLEMDERYGRTGTGVEEWMVTDPVGTTLALSDAAGALATRYAYTPYGAPTASGTPSGNGYQFTGREWDGTGVAHHRARYYSPTLARFISEDPIGFAGGSANLALYALGNPLDLRDVDGFAPQGPPTPPDCGFACRVLEKIASKVGGDGAKNFPAPPSEWAKPSGKPAPRNEYGDGVKNATNDANANGQRFSNPLGGLWNGANNALGGGGG